MKVYLDNSALNRSFDDQTNSRVRLETVAVLMIFELIEKGKIKLVSSSVVEYENSKNPFEERKIWIEAYLSEASFRQKLNQRIKERATEIGKENIDPIDSLHLSCAEAAEVDYFVTCDYDIYRRHKGKLKVVNPINFINLLESK